MIKCAELNREFSTKKEMFLALKAMEGQIIAMKKAEIYKSVEKGQLGNYPSGYHLKADALKGLGFEVKDGYFYPIINTTNYMDSHKDVHFNGLWNRSLSHNKGKIFYLDGHSMKVDDVIAFPEDVNAFVKMIPWRLLGKDYTGETQALVYEIAKEKIQKQSARNIVDSQRKIENSVRMQYVEIFLGIDSNEKSLKENKEYFDKMYDVIANKDVVDEHGYFWGVEEAKIHKEGSMVLAGSNDATPIIYTDPAKSHSDSETALALRKQARKNYFINKLKK